MARKILYRARKGTNRGTIRRTRKTSEEWRILKIFVISSSAIPTPPPEGEYGGLERIAGEFALEAARVGHDVTLISAKGSPLAGEWRFIQDQEKPDVYGILKVHETHVPSWNYGEFQHYIMYREMMENEFGEGQGIIFDSTWQSWSYTSIRGARINNIDIKPHPNMKIVHTHHGMPNSQTPPPGVRFPRFVGVSNGHSQLLSNILKIPVRTVFNGIRLQDYEPDKYSRDGYILSLNRITDEKGIHNCIDLCARNRYPIKVIGDDTKVRQQLYVANIIKQCRESDGLATYYGLVDNDTRNNLLAHCDATIGLPDNYSSMSWIEAFGMYAVEGMAYGKPALGVVNGGLADIIKDGYNGFLRQFPNQLDEVLPLVKDIPHENCRKTVEEKFSVQAMTKSYLDLFDKVMKDEPSGRW